MRRIFVIALALVVVGVCVIDGVSLFYSYKSAQEVALGAAQQAAIEFVTTNGNEGYAEVTARRFAEDKQTELVALKVGQGNARTMQVWTRSESETRLFKYIPFLKNYLTQEYTASVTF